MSQQIESIIGSSLQSDEKVQQGLVSLLELIIERVVEAGVIKLDSQTYRYGSDEISDKNLVKRIINNLGLMTRPMKPYQIGLIDASETTFSARHKMLESQMKMILKSHLQENDCSKVSSDLADVILTSWFLVPRS